MRKTFKLLISTLLILSVVLGLASCDVVTGWFGGSESTYELYKAAKQLQDDAHEFSVSIEWSKLGDKKNTSTVLLDYEENAFSYSLSEVKDGASITEMLAFIDGKIYYLDNNGNKSSYTSTKKDAMDYVENTVVVKLLKPIYECEYPESWFDGIKVSEKGKNKYILMDVTENMSKHHERPDIFVPDSKCEIYLNKDGSFSYIYFKHILIDGVKSDVTVTFDWTENGNIKEPDNKNDYVGKGDFEYDKGHRPGDDNRHPCEKGEHNYVKTVTAPTCTTGGYTTYTCECGDSYVADIKSAIGHNYVPVVTNPTCTTGGYTTYTCECGDSYVADIKGATGHKYVDGVCSYCGEKDPNYNPQAPDYSVGLEYTSNGDGTCYVSGIGTCTDTDIVIPAVSPAGDRVVGIGAHAFENCVNIVSVVIPEGVTYISHISEGWARSFYGCVNLERIVIPDSVTYIGAYAGETVFYNCNKLWEYDNGVFYVNNWAITYEASMITSLNQPTTKASILEIREGTIGIANQAFIFGQYKAVVIPSSVKYIDQVAFWNWGNGECVYYIGTADEWTKIYIEQDNDGVTNHTVYYYSETQPTTDGNFWHWVDGVPTIWEKFTEHVHSFDEFRHVLTPTCTSEGYYYMVCECGEYEIHTIPMTDHTYDSTGKCTWCGKYNSTSGYSVGLEYTSNGDGTCYVSGIGTCTDTDIVIPAVSPEGWTVTSIASDVFPSTLNITSVSLPKTINYLNGNEFTYNKSIKSFAVSGDNPYYASVDGNIYSKDMKTFIRYAPGSDVTSFVVPSSVNQIYNFAFESCGSLVNIVLPEGITSIPFHAFMGCTSLESLKIPDGVRNIDMFAFMACRSLEYIVIPASLTGISSAFDGCDSLTTLFYGGTEGDWKKISIDSMFNDSLLAATVCYYSATEPTTTGNFWHYVDGVPTVWEGHTHNYTTMVTPPTVTENGIVSFTCYCGDTYSETIVPVDFTVTSGNRAMVGYKGENNEKLIIPAVFEDNGTWYRVTEIGNRAFLYCTNLISVTIPEPVTTISEFAFANCTGIMSVTMGDSVVTIGMYAFSACRFTNIEMSNSLTTIGDGAFEYCTALNSLEFGNSVEIIGEYAFEGCTSLVDITIKNIVITIGEGAFYDCDTITSVYYIGTEEEWNNITISNQYGGNSPLLNATRYYYSANEPMTAGNFWHYVNGMPTVWPAYIEPEEGLEFALNFDGQSYSVIGIGTCTEADIIIPATYKGLPVTGIAGVAFTALDYLRSVVIPNSVVDIGDTAFFACTSLTDVYYTGNSTEWSEIYIGSDNEYLLSATRYYYSATEPTTTGNFWHYVDGVPTAWPAYVEPEKPYYSEGLEFTLNSDKQSYSLTGIGSCTDADVVIPATYEGLPVTEIQHGALYNCANITSISIPDSITCIYSSAFAECKSIKNFYVDPGNKYYTAIDGNLYSLDGKTLVKYALGKDAKSFVVPDHVTCIGGLAFYASPSLIRVEISDNVTVIGDESFSYCRNLVSIVVGKSVSETYYDTFYGCTSLAEVINKSSLNPVIGSYDYSCMAYYAKYIISDKSESKLKMVGDYIFYDDGIEVYLIRYLGNESEITLPEYEGGKEYGVWHYAFSYNSTLTSVTVPDYITYIGDNVFEETPNLTYNEYDNAYYIGNESNPYLCLIKAKDRNIEYCTICDKTRFICSDAFYDCSYLKSIVIPDSVTIIGGSAFSYCYTLTSVVIGNGVTMIGNRAFSSCRSLTSVVIPDSVTSIGLNAFDDCESLTSVVIPDSVTSIGQGAFMDCENLEFVVIGKGVRSIGNYVFSWCKKLTDVYYTGSAAEWSEIDIAPENQYLTNATIHYNYVI